MRLSPEEVAAIRQAAREVFGAEAVVRLFGSRVRDDLKGGDIDLHVEAPGEVTSFANERRFLVRLEDLIGEERVDLVVRDLGKPERPIDRIAKAEGMVLS